MLSNAKAVDDPDQRWMLDEWIRYVADPASRIIEPPHLGDHWSRIVRAAKERNLEAVAARVPSLVAQWDGYLRKLAQRLRAKLGADVVVKVPRSESKNPTARSTRMTREVMADSRLSGELSVPAAAGDVTIDLFLTSNTVCFGLVIKAPPEGRQKTRVNWLIRQLKDLGAKEDLRIEVDWDRRGLSSHARLDQVLQDETCLLRAPEGVPIPRDAFPRRFHLEWSRPLKKVRGKSSTAVLEGVSVDFETFYRGVVEKLKPFTPSVPKLPSVQPMPVDAGDDEPEAAPVEPSVVPVEAP